MNNFAIRTITGLSYVAVILLSLWLHPMAFTGLLMVFTFQGILEFNRLTSKNLKIVELIPSIIAGVFIIAGNFIYLIHLADNRIIIAMVPVTFIVLLTEAYIQKEHMLQSVARTVLSIAYIPLPLSLILFMLFPGINGGKYTYEIVLGYFILLWLFDTGAYIFGSLLGKHKIMPAVSPGKSWEGFAGGLIIAAGTALLLAKIFPVISLTDWIILIPVIAVTGTAGDLFESVLKRNAGVKDSGKLLPGHGGILDRIDSILVSGPFVLLYLSLRGYIV